MKISPLDIRKQTFRTTFRGADPEEVRVFLDLLATEYENTLQENVQLKERLHHCEDRLVEYRELDQTLRNSLLTAERLASEAKESAQKDADGILQDAEWRAKQILEDARERLMRLSEEIRGLRAKKESYAQHLRSFLQAQMELLDNNEPYLDGIDKLTIEAHELAANVDRPPVPAPTEATVPGTEPVGQTGRREVSEPPPAPEGQEGLSFENRQTTPTAPVVPPARSLGRPYEPPPREREEDPLFASDAADETTPAPKPVHERPEEKSEGLFEISAEEEPPPGI